MSLISYHRAQEMIVALATSFEKEEVKLDDALGKILAEDVPAGRDYPPFNRAAVDGFAIRTVDFDSGLRDFEVVETIFAGQESCIAITTGECYKIMTGAAVPLFADAVIRREDVMEVLKSVKVHAEACGPFKNIALRGQDLKKGELALTAPFKLNVSSIGLLASLGRSRVLVKKSPRVAIVTTGNEVVPVEQKASDLQIHNSNLHVLKALLYENGIKAVSSIHVLDQEKELEIAVEAHLHYDLLILTGGVSAGDADYVPGVLSRLGVRNLFHKVAIKPGKPVCCGQMPNNRLVFALPGNPFSCLVTFKLFVEPYLQACSGITIKPLFKLPVGFDRIKKTGFDEFFPVSVTGERALLTEDPLNGSGDIRLGSFSDALAIHPAGQLKITAGEEIYYLPFNSY